MKRRTMVVHVNERDYDVYIGRPSKWGNPFVISETCSRTEAINKYSEWFAKQTNLHSQLQELVGKRLGCWCYPRPCHGDVLVEWIRKLGYE